jgi:hypothetical protein
MKREPLNSSPGGALPHTEPSKLFAVVCAVSLVFFIAYWPHEGNAGAAALAARRAGPTAAPGAAEVQPPPAAAAAQQQQAPGGLLGSLVPSWGYSGSAADAADAPPEDQQQQPDHPPATLPEGDASKVQLNLYLMSMCPDANVCEHTFHRVLERLHPIVHVNTRCAGGKGRGRGGRGGLAGAMPAGAGAMPAGAGAMPAGAGATQSSCWRMAALARQMTSRVT